MSYRQPARTASRRIRSAATTLRTTSITIYGCEPDEAALFRTMAPRFGVLPTITGAAPTEATSDLAAGNRCVSVGHRARITNSTLLALRRAGVEYVSTRSVGYDHLDVNYAASIGLSVGNVAYSPDSVADYTLMLILMAVRSAKSVIHRTETHDYRPTEARGKELRDLTVGVIGTGRIGTAVIGRLRGFRSRVLAHDNRPFAAGESGVRAEYVPLDELVRRSDVVTLHTPLTPDTHHLLDSRRIARLKQGAFVVNTGRGSLLDTEALVDGLESGRLGGAALDVLEGEEGIFYTDHRDEPIGNESLLRLQRLPNVLISPHIAYYTEHALSDVVENSLRNCVRFESGEQHG